MPRELEDLTFICFGGVDWETHRQRPQHLMSIFAERGARVVYVDNLGTRAPRWADLPRIRRRIGAWRKGRERPADTDDTLIRLTPPPLPILDIAGIKHITAEMICGTIARLAGPRRKRLIVWTYLPLPIIRDVAKHLEADLLVYDWVDDASRRSLASDRRKTKLRTWEDAMARSADVVFLATDELLHLRRPSTLRVEIVGHGVTRTTQAKFPPEEVLSMPSPRVGYVGTIGHWTDTELVATLARDRPDWSFILVGPVRKAIHELADKPNVLLTGERPHDEVPALLSSFDAAIIPYRESPSTRAVSPIKLREYLDAGLPIVSVDLPDVRPFSPPVRLAGNAAQFQHELLRALREPRTSAHPEIRTWTEQADTMIATLRRALQYPQAE